MVWHFCGTALRRKHKRKIDLYGNSRKTGSLSLDGPVFLLYILMC